MIRWLFALLLVALPATAAEEVVLGLSQSEVAITTNFNGSEIFVFGAIKRDAPMPEGDMGVIVTISGPPVPVSVRKKERRFGIWVNTDVVEIEAAPSYYAVATSGPLEDVLSTRENILRKVSVPSMIQSISAPTTVLDATGYVNALIRIRENAEAFQLLEGQVVVDDDTLFRTRIKLPAALTEGAYQTRILLTRDGAVVDQYQTAIDVRKVGLERWLYSLSRNQPFLYGLMSLAIAIFAGWSASAAFSLLRN
ncbi:TIGR02186 family protein [uncultured Tateyamaria sp.]|uniref:TIGR02186 family protein n=1 Tax=uncultured Tateyamaria sp. TaxID=455651 RepID=UPI002621BDA4|nr:TIGR02186 family protein [uncultured Tateyamaria sp.]